MILGDVVVGTVGSTVYASRATGILIIKTPSFQETRYV
jgi:hypothetical protein